MLETIHIVIINIYCSTIRCLTQFLPPTPLCSNMGGPSAALRTMQARNQAPYCTSCCPSEPTAFYNRIMSSLWWLFFVRVPLITIATICSYKGLNKIYATTTLISLLMIGHSVGCLISFYENNYHLNMGHVYKMVTVKLSVGIIVVEAVIETLLYMTGTFNNLNPAPGYSIEGTVVRMFCFIVLLEYIVLSLAMWMIWSEPVAFLGFPSSADSDSGDSAIEGGTSKRPSASAGISTNDGYQKPTLGAFLGDVFSFMDMWGKYTLALPAGTDLRDPLIPSGSGSGSSAYNL
jgi:hypothetical protein